MDNFREFATKRVAIGIICVVLITWGVYWVFQGKDEKTAPAISHEAAERKQPQAHGTAPKAADSHSTGDHRPSLVDDIKDRRVAALNADITAWEALDTLKREYGNIDRLREFYVTDSQGALVGKGSLVRLMAVGDEVKLREFMDKDPLSVPDNMKIEAVSELMTSHHETQLPVVDTRGHLVGAVSSVAIMDALKSKTGEATAQHEETPQPSSEHQASSHSLTENETAEKAAQSDAHGTDHAVAKTETPSGHAEEQPAGTIHKLASTPEATQPANSHGEAAGEEQSTAAAGTAHNTEAGDEGHGEGAEHPWPPPVPRVRGLAFVEALVNPLDYELNHRFWGWRPNDIFSLGDNVVNFQLGVLEVTRRISVVLREKLAKTGTIEAYDPSIEKATDLLNIMPTRYWFPSAESEYNRALSELMKYHDRLETGHASFYIRTDNLVPLLEYLELLLGSSEDDLVKKTEKGGAPVSAFSADNYFYYTQGAITAIYHILYALAVDYWPVMESRKVTEVLHDAIESCHHALDINPWVITNSPPSGILANHRANLAAPVSHARFFIGVLIKALST
jgi:CBS domain-containing protein